MWFFAPPSALATLAVPRGRFVNVLGNRRRADKAYCHDIRISQNSVDCLFISMNNVKDAVGQSSFFQPRGKD